MTSNAGSSMTLAPRCRGCHATAADFRVLLAMDPMPLAGQFCRTLEESQAVAVFPLTWVQCGDCQLVQVLEDISDDLLFQTYNYASSSVTGLVRHFERYAALLTQRYGKSSIRFLEIGCNDGVLLRRLPPSWSRVGVDPSDVARNNRTREYQLFNVPFNHSLFPQLLPYGELDVISASNCLAHIHDVKEVFTVAALALHEGGDLWIEVHDLEATLEGGQWDTIYHEHKVEWSLQSLSQCVQTVGFELRGATRLPLHGGLLRACYRKVSVPSTSVVPPSKVDAAWFASLKRAYEQRRESSAYTQLASASRAGSSISAYGASGRANVWLNQLPELSFEYIVDDSPLRNNRWIPRVGTPIVASAHFEKRPTDVCMITAWNYADDIRGKHPTFAGTWLQSFTGS